MSTLTPQTTVSAMVAERPLRTRVLEKLGIEYCCSGKVTLQEACARKGLDAASVIATLEASEAFADHSGPDISAMNMTELADHIVKTHHAYLQEELPRLRPLINKVATVHGKSYPWMVELRDVYEGLSEELLSHLQKEEQILFPAIRNLESGEAAMNIGAPVEMMEHEHAEAGAALARIRELSSDFTAPEGACNTFRGVLASLEKLERDTHEHISLENNILFPRAIATFGGQA